jgi:hypothetical protein
MQMTPRRQALIDAHVAETRRRMTDIAFELNDLVRFAIAASREKPHRLYHPMDPVHEGIRAWAELDRKLSRLAGEVSRTAATLGVPPFDAEGPVEQDDPNGAPAAEAGP